MRRLLACTATFTLLFALPAVADGGDQFVDASPTIDGLALHRSAVQVTTARGDTVDNSNVAQANPHNCTGCEGIAVAYQAVITTGRATTVTPTNLAAAVNSNCTSCGAFAYAYQYVVKADRHAHLSREANARIEDIRRQAAAAVDEGLPYDQLDAKLRDLAVQFRAARDDGLSQTGGHADGGNDVQQENAQPAG